MDNRFKKRRVRRRMVKAIIHTLGEILNMEVNYYLSIPDTKANEERNDDSAYTIDTLVEIIESLRNIF